MQSSIPKQYLPLAGKTVLQVSLEKLQRLQCLAGCVVAISADDVYFDQYCPFLPRIVRVEGGSERATSVLSGLQYLMNNGCEQDWGLVHDAARPGVKSENLQRLVDEVLKTGVGGILAVPVADTLKTVSDGIVQSTLDRLAIWQAHTPQMFRVGELYFAIEQALAQRLVITDESSAMELAGYSPQVICDSRDNIKITQAEDLALAEWILQQQINTGSYQCE